MESEDSAQPTEFPPRLGKVASRALTAKGYTSLGGTLPVNASGGLLSRGHPVGATGVAQICELYWQLTGAANGRQVDRARIGLAYCKGGSVSGTDGASVTTVVLSN